MAELHRRTQYKIAFIENSISNDIFLTSVISKQDLKDRIFQNIMIGLPTNSSLNRPIEIEFTNFQALHTCGEWTWFSNKHNPRFPKNKFLHNYQTARSAYLKRLQEHEKEIELKRRKLDAKVSVFKQVYNNHKHLAHQHFNELVKKTGEEVTTAERLCFQQFNVVSRWFVIAEWNKPISIYILLAKFLGMNELTVSGWYLSKEGSFTGEYSELGSDAVFFNSPIDQHSIYRCWMLYDEFFDIDVLCDNFNQLFNDDLFPETLVVLSEGPCGIPYPKEFGVSEKIKKLQLQSTPDNYVLDPEEFDASFVNNHNQLKQVYQLLVSNLEARE